MAIEELFYGLAKQFKLGLFQDVPHGAPSMARESGKC